jgi:serine/threonine protein kinase
MSEEKKGPDRPTHDGLGEQYPGRTESWDDYSDGSGRPTEVIEPGDRLGSYEILDLIGTGGMGRVYSARDSKLGRRVALKVLAGDLVSDPLSLQRWRREAETVAALNHPNIVSLFSVEEVEETRFFTMELVEGRSLDKLIPRRGMPVQQFFEVAIPLADALAAAHDQGVAHRDLKPGNIMVSKQGWIKVLDFGRPSWWTTRTPSRRITSPSRSPARGW